MTTNKMADKKSAKQISSDETPRPEKSESGADFLARTGVNRQIQEVISLTLENKPEDPIAFLADYFANIAEHVASLTQAHQCLCLSHHTKPTFQSNLLKAYSILNHQKCGHGLRGLTGKTYNELLAMVCRDVKSTEADNLLKLLNKKEKEVIRFNVFISSITCCFVFKDFLKEAEALFSLLDISGKGIADHALCLAMLSQLSETVSHTHGNSLSILEAGVSLSSQNIDITMKKALADSFSHNTGKTMMIEEFVREASHIFFSKVPGVQNH